MLFLETTVLFSYYALLCQLVMQLHLNYWSVRQTAEQFLSVYVLNINRTADVGKREGFDIVSASEMNCNGRVSMQQPAYLTRTNYTCI